MLITRDHQRKLTAIFLLLLGVFTCGVAAAQTAAGQVMFSFGNVTITGADGAVREARRGEQIFSGDTVTTAAGRIQIKYTDGSIVSLTPNTEYKLDDYNFSGSADGTERGFFRLVKGGLRTVTGAIGRGDKANYRLTTPVATIGIRGTWFRALLDQFGRLLVSVGFDPDDPSGLIIANAVGQLELDRGENAVVENADTPPVRTEQQVVLEVPQPSAEPQFVAGDERDGDTQTILPTSTVPTGPPVFTNGVAAATDNATLPPAGVGSDVFANGVAIGTPPTTLFGTELGGTPQNSFATIDLDAAQQVSDPAIASQVQTFVNLANPADISFFQAKPAQVMDFETIDGVLSMGRWTGGRILFIDDQGGTGSEVDDLMGNQSLHFIFGPTPTDPLPGPSTGIFTYNFASAVDSTSESGATIGNGAINGQLFLDAAGATPFVTLNMDVQHNAIVYNVFGSVDIEPGGFAFGNQFGGFMDASGGVGACSGVCPANIDGTFSGPGTPPSHAGVAYIIFDTDPIHGVVGFRK